MDNKFKGLKLKSLNTTTITTLLIYAMLEGLMYLHSKSIIAIPEFILTKINIITIVIITFFITSLILRLTVKRVFNFFDEREEKLFFTKIYRWSAYTLATLYILYVLGVSLNNITLLIGLIATGLAFAIRDVLISFFSWIILLRKKPFRIGDYIRIGEDEGVVQHIGTFYVILDKTPDYSEDYTRVPNRIFLEKSINNYGRKSIRETIKFQLNEIPKDYKKSLEILKKKLEKKIEKSDYVLVNIDLINEKIFLIVEYYVIFQQKQSTRTEVLTTTFEEMKKYIVIVKN